MGKRIERPQLSRGNTRSNLVKNLGVFWLAFPHLKPAAASRSEISGDEPARVGEQRVVAAAFLLRDACLGGAHEVQAPVSWLRGAALGACPPIADFEPPQGVTALGARVPVAELGPWSKGAALCARAPFVENEPWLGGGTLGALVPTAGTTP